MYVNNRMEVNLKNGEVTSPYLNQGVKFTSFSKLFSPRNPENKTWNK